MRRLKVIRYQWHSHRLVTLCDVESSQRSRLSLFPELGHLITDISRHLIEPQSVSVLSDGKLFVCDWSDDAIKRLFPDPISVAFTASGNIVVVQSESSQRSRLSLFTELGHFITDISRHLIEPQSVSVRSDGKLLVCDWSDDAIKVLSPDGTKLMQTIKAPNCDDFPWFAVHYQSMYFVSYHSAH